jgi:hypothetical protein
VEVLAVSVELAARATDRPGASAEARPRHDHEATPPRATGQRAYQALSGTHPRPPGPGTAIRLCPASTSAARDCLLVVQALAGKAPRIARARAAVRCRRAQRNRARVPCVRIRVVHRCVCPHSAGSRPVLVGAFSACGYFGGSSSRGLVVRWPRCLIVRCPRGRGLVGSGVRYNVSRPGRWWGPLRDA